MEFPENYRKTVAAVLMATLLLIVAPTSGFAASETIIPPGDAQAPTGMTYGEWSRAWWQYVLEIPFENNPLFDETGANCNFGQEGPVFFLVATDGGTATRSECRVPAGKILFFPLLGVANLREAGDRQPELASRASIKGFTESTRVLQANIDGQDVDISLDPDTTPLRTLSPAGFFTVIAPENNILGAVPGQSFHTVTDGFYLMVAPLPPGPHTITFGATSRYFASYVTYNLIVEGP